MRTIELKVKPRETATWEDFLGEPACSIALDGYVTDAPNYDHQGLHVNFDHHHGVVRDATMSTAEQAFMAVKTGLYEAFQKDGKPYAVVYINDCDEDTCLAVFILDNPKLFEGTNSQPSFNRLLALDSKWDITGGAFPASIDEDLMQAHNWIFEPYYEIRRSGQLSIADSSVMSLCIENVCGRIMKFILGQGERLAVDTRINVKQQSAIVNGLMLIEEIGGNAARRQMFSKGMNAFLSIVVKKDDGSYVYSIGKKSKYIPIDLQAIYAELNAIEGLTREKGWGGSDIIGGAPRMGGSKLEPEFVFSVIEKYKL